jgi:SAM-dependent methyltransferase
LTATASSSVLAVRRPSCWGETMRLYRFSVALGLRSLTPRHAGAALPRILNPLSYPRGVEFSLTMRGLSLPERGLVLDVGSPKLLFIWLAATSKLDLTATDIMNDFIPKTAHLLGHLGLAREIGQRLRLEAQDARELTYGDASFDAAYSISVLEHVPDNGDSRAIREIGRVLKPGGRLCLTVPFALRYSEDWVGQDVFERRRKSRERVFFQRRYDLKALRERLIEPSGLRETTRVYFGEPGLPFDRYWNRLPVLMRLPAAWAQPLFERAFLRELDEPQCERAIGVALTLTKEEGAGV